jgi:hypothetical protein
MVVMKNVGTAMVTIERGIPVRADRRTAGGKFYGEGRRAVMELGAAPIGSSIWIKKIPRDAKGSLIAVERTAPLRFAIDREKRQGVAGYRIWRVA